MTVLPPENVDRVEQATSAFLAKTLDDQRGRTVAAFRERIAHGTAEVFPASYPFPADGLRRLKIWAGAASALAACLALVVTVQFVMQHGGGSQTFPHALANGHPDPAITNVSAPAIDQVELSRDLDGGTTLLRDNTPVRVVRRQTLRQTQWFDPQDRATYQMTEPGEQVNYVPVYTRIKRPDGKSVAAEAVKGSSMRKIMSMSALVSSLLASPLLAKLPVEAERTVALQQRMADAARERIEQALALRAGAGALVFVDSPAPPATNSSSVPGLIPAVQPMEKVAFLGIVSSPASPALRDQVKLQRGFGLVVDMVLKESPAAAAGVQLHDILEKLDDQRLVNGEQLSALVRAKNVGDTLTLTVIRGGERKPLTVTLGEREVPAIEEQNGFRLNASGPVGLAPLDGGAAWQQGLHKTILHAPDGTTTRTLVNGQGVITLVTAPDGQSTLTVKDKNQVEQFNGPWSTDEDKAKVPPAYAATVRDLALSHAPVTVHLGDKILSAQNLNFSRNDAEQRITLSINDAGRAVMVADNKSGKVMYDGPLNAEEDWKKLPPEAIGKIKEMELKLGLAQADLQH